jgi:dTMP kinase
MAVMRHQRARLVVLEGIDGSGKTSLSGEIANTLIRYGLKVIQTRQPTALPSGRCVRRIARAGRTSNSLSAALYKDRRAHYCVTLRPAFQSADVIICDRYFYSSIYQAKNMRDLRSRLEFYRRLLPIPDLAFLLLPSVMAARRRILSSGRRLDGFETRMALYRARYYSLRSYREIVLCTTNLPLNSLASFCISKILTKCGAVRNRTRQGSNVTAHLSPSVYHHE